MSCDSHMSSHVILCCLHLVCIYVVLFAWSNLSCDSHVIVMFLVHKYVLFVISPSVHKCRKPLCSKHSFVPVFAYSVYA